MVAAREAHGVDVSVLRLLDAERVDGCGGPVSYLAEVADPVDGLLPWTGSLGDHPLRLPYRPPRRAGRGPGVGGRRARPARTAAVGTRPAGPHLEPVQRVAAADRAGVGLAEGRAAVLRPRGPGDLAAGPGGEAALARHADQLDAATASACWLLVDGLPERFAALERCGVPDTLVHGDFHPGNLRGERDGHSQPDGRRPTLLDWGDCGVGHPLMDRAAFLDRSPAEHREDVVSRWDDAWRLAVPGAEARWSGPCQDTGPPTVLCRTLSWKPATTSRGGAADPSPIRSSRTSRASVAISPASCATVLSVGVL